jgi:hypothetical protein
MVPLFSRFHQTLIAALAAIGGVAISAAQTAPAKEGTQGEIKPEKSPNFAFLCLNSNSDPKSDELKAKLVTWLSLDSPDRLAKFQIGRKSETTVTMFEVGERFVTLARFDSPIPKEDIAYACANSPRWPQAAEKLAAHKGHLNVSVSGKFADAVDLALFVSRVVAACTEAYDTAGVYWGHATIVHSPEFFREQVKDSNRVDLPILAWIGFLESAGKEPDTFDLYSRGLDVFGVMEIEAIGVKGKPTEVAVMIAELGDHMLKNGNVIKDGHTLSPPDAEKKIHVRHAKSVLGREGNVLRIEF